MRRAVLFHLLACVGLFLVGCGGMAPFNFKGIRPETPITAIAFNLNTSLELRWAHADDARIVGYRVYYSTEEFDLLRDAESVSDYLTEKSFTLDNPQTDTSYYFAVVGLNSRGNAGARSEIVQLDYDRLAIYVHPYGDDANDGYDSGAPKLTIASALTEARTLDQPSKLVIAEGTYSESISIAEDIALYGGYSVSSWDLRDVEEYPTILRDPNTTNQYTVNSQANPYIELDGEENTPILDGFEIQFASTADAPTLGGGISIVAQNNAVISRNTIVGRTFPSTSSIGILASGSGGSFVIEENTIKDFSVTAASHVFVGIAVSKAQGTPETLTISNNTIEDNNANGGSTFAGISIEAAQTATISNNFVAGANAGSTTNIYGIITSISTADAGIDVFNNVFLSNGGGVSSGGGKSVACAISAAVNGTHRWRNNHCEAGGISSLEPFGTAFSLASSSAGSGEVILENNIFHISTNTFLKVGAFMSGSDFAITLRNNIFSGVSTLFYDAVRSASYLSISAMENSSSGIAQISGSSAANNIDLDLSDSNFDASRHLSSSAASAIEDNLYSGLNGEEEEFGFTTDRDGNARPSTGGWSIGPYEYQDVEE